MKEFKEFPFVVYLEKLRERKDTAALARLRRGLGKKMGTAEMYPYVVPFFPVEAFPREQEHYFLVASLFALHPETSPKGVTFGKVLKRIWDESNRSESIEKRFINLLSTDADDIGGHLRHAVSLARSRRVPVDYHRLFYDIRYWNHPDRFVQLEWARDFWRKDRQETEDNDNAKGEAK